MLFCILYSTWFFLCFGYYLAISFFFFYHIFNFEISRIYCILLAKLFPLARYSPRFFFFQKIEIINTYFVTNVKYQVFRRVYRNFNWIQLQRVKLVTCNCACMRRDQEENHLRTLFLSKNVVFSPKLPIINGKVCFFTQNVLFLWQRPAETLRKWSWTLLFDYGLFWPPL